MLHRIGKKSGNNPNVHKWINKMLYIHTMEHYSATWMLKYYAIEETSQNRPHI
jgi:outer membrane protein W